MSKRNVYTVWSMVFLLVFSFFGSQPVQSQPDKQNWSRQIASGKLTSAMKSNAEPIEESGSVGSGSSIFGLGSLFSAIGSLLGNIFSPLGGFFGSGPGMLSAPETAKSGDGSTSEEKEFSLPSSNGISPGEDFTRGAQQSDSGPSLKDRFQNGRIPREHLSPVEGGTHLLESKAARAYRRMKKAAAANGVEIHLTDSYRSYSEQKDLKRRKPQLAATPGTSIHGWGRAIDVGDSTSRVNTREAREWIQENGEKYGWVWPEWARPGGRKHEPWHFEYREQ